MTYKRNRWFRKVWTRCNLSNPWLCSKRNRRLLYRLMKENLDRKIVVLWNLPRTVWSSSNNTSNSTFHLTLSSRCNRMTTNESLGPIYLMMATSTLLTRQKMKNRLQATHFRMIRWLMIWELCLANRNSQQPITCLCTSRIPSALSQDLPSNLNRFNLKLKVFQNVFRQTAFPIKFKHARQIMLKHKQLRNKFNVNYNLVDYKMKF